MSPALHLVRVRDQRRRGLALVLASVSAIRLGGLFGGLAGLFPEAQSPQTLGLFVDGPSDHERRETMKANNDANNTTAVASHHFARVSWRGTSLP